ncbi:MAG: divergent PAP2 family protein [Oscillospiraceae bacterium]|nr:divergent PAP2 family protein [Oscillospiraceae bacterium]
MEFFHDIYNPALLAALMSWLTAQIIKTLLYVLTHKKFSVERFWGAGGMPSSHAAAVCSLAVVIGAVEGVQSAVFALAMIFALVVMYDASGVRRAAGLHAREINQIKNIIENFGAEMRKPGAKTFEETKKQLKEFLGHSPVEVFMGAMLGVAVGILFALV